MKLDTIINQPVLETDRCVLRPLRRSDMGLIEFYGSDARVARMTTSIPHPLPPGATEAFVARAMAEGVRASFETDLGIGITGIAGPGGGTPEKPVGMVHLALASAQGTIHRQAQYTVDRDLVRILTVKSALDMVRLHLDHNA